MQTHSLRAGGAIRVGDGNIHSPQSPAPTCTSDPVLQLEGWVSLLFHGA